MNAFVINKKIKLMLSLLAVTLGLAFLSWSNTGSFADMDKDGMPDGMDNCPENPNSDQADFDLDKIGDVCDEDDDNDGVIDSIDQFDNEATEWNDYDLDSIGDNKDTDDDNDGVIDSIDQFDANALDWADFDFDGIGSSEDTDDDNDGILDADDSQPILYSESLAIKYLQNIESCAETDQDTLRLLCYSEFFSRIAEIEGSNSGAIELAIALSKMNTIDDCHFVSHEIGHASYNQTRDVAKSLKGMDATMCRGGYFHGVLGAYFHNIEESGEDLPASYDKLCDDLVGSSNYQDCIHGMGHGVVHYFGDDLDSALKSCDSLSFYQDILCTKGVMMQYTDNILTRDGISTRVISDLCDAEKMEKFDFVECSMSIGTTVAFFTDHDFKKGTQSCDLIENKETRDYCTEGLRLEIEDSERYEKSPLTEELREKFQPQVTVEGFKIDIRSPAIVSDFSFVSELGMMRFSVDRPQYVIMYVPDEILPHKVSITVNGQIPDQLEVKSNVLGKSITMIRFVPDMSGTILITPLT